MLWDFYVEESLKFVVFAPFGRDGPIGSYRETFGSFLRKNLLRVLRVGEMDSGGCAGIPSFLKTRLSISKLTQWFSGFSIHQNTGRACSNADRWASPSELLV